MEPKNLKLIARTEEDLRVVSAHLQDSIASIADIAPSIAEALIATGMGLFVAIPSLIAYNHFSNRINVLKQECMDIEDETINMNNKLFSSKSNRGNNGK